RPKPSPTATPQSTPRTTSRAASKLAPLAPSTSATSTTRTPKPLAAPTFRTASGCWNRSPPLAKSTTGQRKTGCAKSPAPHAPERSPLVDRELITRGLRRWSPPHFLLWLTPWVALLLFGAYCAGLCLVKGLNQTNMDNRYAFGLWIFVDLTI